MKLHEHYFRPLVPDGELDGKLFRSFRCECGENYSTEIFRDGDMSASVEEEIL